MAHNQADNPIGPNILISGTPGTGKTTLASELASRSGLTSLNINDIAAENDYFEGVDEQLSCKILDEDRLLDDLEMRIKDGGMILDYHGSDFFPQRWFDAVFVLTTSNNILHKRLTDRGYDERKILENIQCEIMEVLLEEARESYDPEIVHELKSDAPDDLESNLDRIILWIDNWKHQHGIH